MTAAIIRWSLENRFVVLSLTVLALGWGVFAVHTVPIDAMPDLSENQVIVETEWAGHSPNEIETQITRPLSMNLQGLSGLRAVRASSMFGFSFITVVFSDETDPLSARARVAERLSAHATELPADARYKLGPEASGLGWVFQYYLDDTSHREDLGSLRALQDNFIRPHLAAVPGVAEIASIGGFVRQWEIELSALRLAHHGIGLHEILDAVARNNLSVGGRTVEENGREFIVSGRGLITEAADLESTTLTTRHGGIISLRDVATIRVGGKFRRGALDVDGREVVGGTVVMRAGENARQVIRDTQAALARLAPGLPAGVAIKPFYDRSDLIDGALNTLRASLWESVVLVTLVHVFFLAHFRSILIVTLPLPASILIAFILMKTASIHSHLMSLTGIAIAIGVLVDAAIVLVENVMRRCAIAEAGLGRKLRGQETWAHTLEGAQQVARPLVFAMLIIILAFAPVFALTGQEGKLFHPLAWTKTFAMIGATLLAVTLVPVLCTLLVRGPFQAEERNWFMRAALALYDPALSWALVHRKTVLGLAAGIFGCALIAAFGVPVWIARSFSTDGETPHWLRGFGTEFMPALEEGALVFMPVLPPGTSLTEVQRILAWQDKLIRATPEVTSVAGKLGRFDTATDPAPVEMIETTIQLKPRAQWRNGLTREQLLAELTAKLHQVPGYVPGFLQPIESRILMLSTGVRGQLGIKIFGDDSAALQQKALEIATLVEKIPGAVGVTPSRTQFRPYMEISVNRAALAHYGLSAAEVLVVAEAGIGGKHAGFSFRGRERWPIQVRFERADREDLERLAALPVPIRQLATEKNASAAAMGDMLSSLSPPPPGRMSSMRLPPGTAIDTSPQLDASPAVVALGQIATIRRVLGSSEIASENSRLLAVVQANVSGRDLGSFVKEVHENISREIEFPPGMVVEYSGQYEHQVRARATLRWVMPAVLLITFVLLALAFRSPIEAAHVLLAVPFALSGGVFLQAALGFNFSVAVWIGYIALFGTAIQTGIVMVTYLDAAVQQQRTARGAKLTRSELLNAVKAGARQRLRPKLMTVATTVAALVPIFWSTRVGTEVMQPIAAPVLGGMISSLLHILIVTPVIFAWLRERELRADAH
ncbi:efflux RND transporter permease subunit [Oleiharenicola lentus]|uniref:efflux RND transporter permease subunit n=1 Tax=Oleiharenicola lentus TaxID=2508720 RepID=UPI003F6721FE